MHPNQVEVVKCIDRGLKLSARLYIKRNIKKAYIKFDIELHCKRIIKWECASLPLNEEREVLKVKMFNTNLIANATFFLRFTF